MIDLRELIAAYRSLVRAVLKQFEQEHAYVVWSCFAFDAAPPHGRLGLGFDTRENSDSIVDKYSKNGPAWFGEDNAGRFNNNCADFTYCRYYDQDIDHDWVTHWGSDRPFRYLDLQGKQCSIEQQETGDEGFNSIIFPVLTRARDMELDWIRANSLNRASTARFGVQMCDSEQESFVLI